jgi:hypothetical protein
MDFLEKDLEDIIYEAYETKNQNFLVERGLDVFNHDYIIRQLNLGDYGVADLVGINLYPSFYRSSNTEDFFVVTIYELKKDTISMSTFSQAIKYSKAITDYLSSQKITRYYIEYVLVGKSISLSDDNLCFLRDVTNNVHTYTYSYSFDGIKFKKTNSYVKGTGLYGVSMPKLKPMLFRWFTQLKKNKILSREIEILKAENEFMATNEDIE